MKKQTKKILYIDPVCLEGHLNFNKIQISALISQGFQVDICATTDYYHSLECDDVNLIYEIPKGEIIADKGGLKYRGAMIKVLFKVKKNVILSNYDAVIISCYDEIALSLSFFPSSYIINHNNICKLNNPIKKLFFKLSTKRHKHIVLCESAKRYIKNNYPLAHVYKIKHGLPSPINAVKKESNMFTIFAPSKSSTDISSTQELLLNDDFNSWLKKNNIQFIVRGDFKIRQDSNIQLLKGFLTQEEYSNLFFNADCIFINYPQTFRYRVSAVLFESIANRKPCVIFDIPEFEEYKDIIPEIYFFSNPSKLMSTLIWIKNNPNEIKFNDYLIRKLQPDYSFLKYIISND